MDLISKVTCRSFFKQAEIKRETIVAEQDGFYQNLIRHLPGAVYTCDAQGYITFYNEAAVALWGREPEAGKELWCGSWKAYYTDGTPMSLDDCPMARTLKEGKAITGEEIIVERPDGKRRNILPHPSPLFDTSGKLIGAMNMFMDITEKKRIDQALQESEKRYRRLVHGLPVAVYTCDTSGRILLYNKSAVELWGREPDPEKDLWCGAWKLYHVDETPLPFSEAPLAVAVEKGQFTRGEELIMERKDGSRRYIIPHPQPIHNSSGKLVAVLNMVEDITEQRLADQALQNLTESLREKVDERTIELKRRNTELKKSEERYHKMVEEVEDYAILLLSKEGIIQNWNRGAEKIKGYKESEVVGKHFSVFYLPEDQEDNLPRKLIARATKYGKANHEGWRVRKDGTTFWGSIVISALHDEQGNVMGFSKVTRDLTERKKAEERMTQYMSELEFRNKELEQFAYIASHDLQEPLRKIQTFAELLGENLDNDEPAQKNLEKINSAAQRMSALVKDVLSYSRLANLDSQFVDVDLNKIIQNVQSDFEIQISQKQAVIHRKRLPVIKAIPVQLQQLFSNLLSNSLKFAKNNLVIDISYKLLTNGNVKKHPQLTAGRSYYQITFKDNGIGFEPQYSDQIFKLFSQLNDRKKYVGTGIGLAICKKIVENHKGYIAATGELDKGATFIIYLPVEKINSEDPVEDEK